MSQRRVPIAMALTLALAVLSPPGCTYDYGALAGRPDLGAGQTGGSTSGTGGREGTASTGGHMGAAGAASGGRPGVVVVSGSGGVGTGGAGTGGRGAGGVGGGDLVPRTGGAGGRSLDGAAGGAGGVGGRGGAGAGGAAVAAIISIDFVGGMPMNVPATGGAGGNGGNGGSAATTVLIAAPAMAPTEVAGVRPAARWNSAPGLTGTLNNLVHADGVISSASATWKATPGENGPGVWKNRFADAPGNIRMMNGYLDPTSNALPATVVVSNLPADVAAAGYDVYVYVAGDFPSGTRTYTYAIGASTASVVQTGPTATTFSGFVLAPEGGMGNYVVFRNVTGSTFTLTARPPVGTLTRAPLNGMQIVSPPGS